MASMGSLVVDLQANTRQFDQAIQRSRETMTAFAEGTDRKSTRLNSSHVSESRMPSSA